MPKLVAVTILLVIVLGYALMFVSWNMTPVTVIGLKVGAESYWESIPVAYLPLAGIGVGVVAMALVSLGQWLAMKGQVRKLSGQVAKAREVIEYQKRRISELESSVDDLRREQEDKQEQAQETPAAPIEVELAEDTEGSDPEVI